MKQYTIILLMLCSNCFFAQQNKTTIDTTFSDKGKIESITYKTNGKKDKVINYYEGEIMSEFNFKNGIRDGVSIQYNYKKKGRVQAKSIYKDGLLNGVFETYNDTGKIISTGNYENGLQMGPFITYYDNGNKRYVYNYKDGKFDGKQISYYKNGSPSSESSYKNSKLDGIFTYYYENGNKQYTGTYKEGKMFGERLCYDEDGKLNNGDFRTYSEDGLIQKECKCINGKPEGELKVYVSGTLSYTVNFKDGKPDGFLIYRNNNNKEVYKNGVFVKEIKEDTKVNPQ